MQVGLMAPQGWKGEYDGWDAGRRLGADGRARPQAEDARLRVARGSSTTSTTVPRADRRDHVRVVLDRSSALAMATERVRLGHMVVCTGFRNPALTAKLSSTIDVISGGRFELGIGAGWKEDEWLAYGYGFPPIGERMDAFGDHLEVITRMLAPGRATYEGQYAHVRGAINVPKGIQQPRIPIIVGGNGPQRTAGYAIRFADELNFVFLAPDEIAERMADGPRSAARTRAATRRRSASRCTSATRRSATPARRGSTCSAAFAEIGLDRIVALPDPLVADASRPRRRSPRTAGRPASTGRARGRRRPVSASTGRAIRPIRRSGA